MKIEDLRSEACQQQAREKLAAEDGKALPAPDPEAPTKAEVKTEKELQTVCEQELHRRGIAYLHLSPRAREKTGWPDLTFAIKRTEDHPVFPKTRGIPVAVELKSDTGKLSEDQVKMLTQMKDNGWEVYVFRAFAPFHSLLKGRTVKQWERAPE